MTSDGPGCGVAQHPDGCLCDVVVTHPVAVSVHPMDFEYGRLIANALGVEHYDLVPAEKQLQFLTALTQAHDALVSTDTDKLAEDNRPTAEGLELMRSRLKAYLRGGGKVRDAEDEIDLDLTDIKLTLACGQVTQGVTWGWSLAHFDFFERLLDERELGQKALAQAVGGTHTSIRKLAIFFRGEDYFEHRRNPSLERFHKAKLVSA